MESLLQRYEQRVFDLEESEVDLRERLTGAQGSLGSLIYWSFVVLTSGGVRPKLPKLAIGTSAAAHYIPTSDQSNSIDPKLGLEAHSLDNLTSDLRRQLESQKALVSKLRYELSEMADKEVAYAKTIQEGDQLLANASNQVSPSPSSCQKCAEVDENAIERQGKLQAQLNDLASENSDLLDQVERLRDTERRLRDAQQTEKFLKGRVEELEQVEVTLRTSVSTADKKLLDRESHFQRRIDDLEDELKAQILDNLHDGEEAMMTREGNRHSLRIQVEGLKQQVEAASRDLEEKSVLMQETEASLRSELSKLRAQLNLANSQLSDLDELNLQLREKLRAAQVEIEVQSEEISALSRAREADEMETRKALQEKEQSFIEMEAQFKALRQEAAAASINLSSTPPPGQYLKGGDSEWKLLGSDLSRCESDEHILSRNSSKACLTVQESAGSMTNLSLSSTTSNPNCTDPLQPSQMACQRRFSQITNQLVIANEENRKLRQQVERSGHRNDSLVTRLDETLACLSHCEAKARRKDDLIRRTVDSLLQSEGMRSDSFVRSLRQTTVKPSQMKLVKGRDAFDSLESLCSYVESEAARNRKASPPSKISITR